MSKHNRPMAEILGNVMMLTECGCHIWMGSVNNHDRGTIKVKGKLVYAHRASWELTNGPIPKGLDVLHTCDVGPCINSDHLYVGTHKENMADKARRKRAPYGSRHPKTKITEDVASFIRSSHESSTALAEKFGLSGSGVRNIRNGKRWKYLEAISS